MVVQFVGLMGALRDPGTLQPTVAGTLGALVRFGIGMIPVLRHARGSAAAII